MERLTKRLPDGKTVMDCDSCKQKKDKQCTFYECRASLIKRLAAYEDTGLTPEEVTAVKLALMGKTLAEITEFEGVPLDRLRELAEADKAGRCVVLPPEEYTWKIRGDLVLGIITANCKAAEAERAMEGKT